MTLWLGLRRAEPIPEAKGRFPQNAAVSRDPFTLTRVFHHRPGGDLVQIVSGGLYPGVTVDLVENADQMLAQAVELRTAALALLYDRNRSFDVLEAVLKDRGKGAGRHSGTNAR